MSRHSRLTAALVAGLAISIGIAAEAAPITGGTGPGGVGQTATVSNLILWLEADNITGLSDGQNLVSWSNTATHGSAAGSATVANTAPTFENSLGDLKNGNPVVSFSGRASASVGDVIQGSGSFTAEKTLFAVVQQRAVGGGCCESAISTGIDQNGLGSNSGPWITDWAGAGQNVGAPNKLTFWGVVSGVYDNTVSPYTRLYVDGGGPYTNTTVPKGVAESSYRMGARQNSGDGLGRFLDGNIGEAVIYNGVLNEAQRVAVENYLSAKWDVALTTNNRYIGDDLAQGHYDLDVFGIGQAASTQVTSSGAAGFGIEATAGLNTDGEFVMAGHKVVSNSLTPADVAGMGRWSRSWYVDTNNSSVDVNFYFDFSDAGLAAPSFGEPFKLLFRSNESSLFTPLAVTGTLSGDLVTFSLASGQYASGYYTLGMVPEPSTLVMLAGLGGLGLLGYLRRWRKV